MQPLSFRPVALLSLYWAVDRCVHVPPYLAHSPTAMDVLQSINDEKTNFPETSPKGACVEPCGHAAWPKSIKLMELESAMPVHAVQACMPI